MPTLQETLKSSFEHHFNGSALISLCSHVSQDTFADPQSLIAGTSTIINSSLINSKAEDSVIVDSKVLLSVTLASVVVGADVSGSILEGCTVTKGNTLAPTLEDVRLEGCVIEGSARLIGPWSLAGAARIHEGEWYRAPRFKVITSDNGVIASLTECINGKALIACRCRDMRRWQRSGPRLGRMLGWPAELVQEAWITFEEWLDCPVP